MSPAAQHEDAVPANPPEPATLLRELDRLRAAVAGLNESAASIRLAVQILAGPLRRSLEVLPEGERTRVHSTLDVLEAATRQLNESLARAAKDTGTQPRVVDDPPAPQPSVAATDVLELLRRLEVLIVTRSSLPALVAIDAPAGLVVEVAGSELLRALAHLVEHGIEASARAEPGSGPWTVEVRARSETDGDGAAALVIAIVDGGHGRSPAVRAWLASDEPREPPEGAGGGAEGIARIAAARELVVAAGGVLRLADAGSESAIEVWLPQGPQPREPDAI